MSASKQQSKMPAFKAQYQAVLDARQKQFDLHFSNSDLISLHERAHVRLLDVERVISLAKLRREFKIFELAFKLLGDGLCQVACANYRLAFFCLRSFLELSTAAIKFSAFEFELRQWESGKRDILWNGLCNDDTGVYSRSFAAAFFPILTDETKHYAGLANRAYRECSEYVHGNPSSHGTDVLEPERSKRWFELFDAATTCVFYGFFVRYHSEVGAAIAADSEAVAVLDGELG
ncbi:hypothetical protein, partial [Rhodanobacter sp. L36]|uniref:hypothetical protein n=1 Tax=Rhodanobacter sp. L36 TaxID=1747221 RepID=UPI001C205BDF